MHKILVVEDDPGIFKGIKEAAEGWNLEIKGIENKNSIMKIIRG